MTMRPSISTSLVLTVVLMLLDASAARATSIFISNQTSPGGVIQNETEQINIAGGGSGSLGIWVLPEVNQNLSLIDLNLRVQEPGGNVIDFTGATVLNPEITGAGGAKRWNDGNASPGVGIDNLTSSFITGMFGDATGGGTGLDFANGANDPHYDVSSGAYLFATVDYDFFDINETAELYLQISDDGITDGGGPVSNVIFGLADAALDAGFPFDLNVDSATADAVTIVGAVGCTSIYSADFDCDHDVDTTDLLLWQAGFPTASGATRGNGDADQDMDVDPTDLLLWQGLFPAPASSATSAVPEPASVILLFMGLLALVGRSRRRLP